MSQAAHDAGQRAPTGRSSKVGEVGFSPFFDRMAIRGPLPDIRAYRCKAPAKPGNKLSPRCLHLGWHWDSRVCRSVLAAAAQEDLDDLVDDEQAEG